MKIVTEMPGPTDGTQWYRGAGPLADLSKRNKYLQVNYCREIDWGTLKSANILFLLRPCAPKHFQYIKMAKDLGVKVWIDYDDYLLDVPSDNPAYGYYSNGEVKKTIEMCLSMSDIVSTSTNHLKKLLEKFNSKIVSIPNAIDPVLLKHRPTKDPNQTIVLWRGTSTHQRDLMEYADEIVRIARRDEKIKFAFVGYNPWFITEQIPRQALHFPPVDLFQFNQALCALRPKVTMVPLHDSDFNRSKSNIAALEGSMAGSAILAPDWEEWKMPGIFRYGGKHFYEQFLKDSIVGDMTQRSKDTWEHIEKNYLLKDVNVWRQQIVEELCQ